MPPLTRWTIRLAMLYLVAGTISGALYWLQLQYQWWRPLAALNPVYVHLLVVGWLTQLIYGVIYWMFPIINKTNMRGDPRLAWSAVILLNVGLLLRAISEPWRVMDANPTNAALLTLSAVLQGVAAWLIVIVCWPRVRERAGK